MSNLSIKSLFTQRDKKLIILADDNQLINTCTKKIISQLLNEEEITDVEIICVNDGIDVIKLYLNDEDTQKIRLIITDENMDYLNGSEAIKFIRNIERLKSKNPICIFSLTCNEDNNSGEMIIKAGANTILNKPLSKQRIKSLIEKNNYFV